MNYARALFNRIKAWFGGVTTKVTIDNTEYVVLKPTLRDWLKPTEGIVDESTKKGEDLSISKEEDPETSKLKKEKRAGQLEAKFGRGNIAKGLSDERVKDIIGSYIGADRVKLSSTSPQKPKTIS